MLFVLGIARDVNYALGSCGQPDFLSDLLSLSLVFATFDCQPATEMASSRSFDYLESLPGTVFYKLYQQPATALAIFRRMLPDLGMVARTQLGSC